MHYFAVPFSRQSGPIEHHYANTRYSETKTMKTTLFSYRKFLAVLGFALGFAAMAHAQMCSNQTTVVSILATDGTALEGTSSGAFTLIRYGPTNNDLTVECAISSTASNGVDYETITNPITIPAGWLAIDIPVAPILDTAVRGNKTVCLTLQENGTYAIGRHRAKVQIVDDTFNIPPPSIDLTSPTNGSVFETPASIVLTPEISDEDTQIVCVSFYANDECIGKSTNSPFSFTWNTCRPGCYALFARVVDSLGKCALSCPITIWVTNIVPEVSISSPTNCSEFSEGTNITIEATATDTDTNSTITEVAFYANHHCIGAATSSPYAITWSNVPAGKFSLEAVAIDQNGKRGYSQPVIIKVISTAPPPQPAGWHHDKGQHPPEQHGSRG